MPHGNSACSTWTRRYLLNSNEKLMNGVVREAQTPLFEHPFKLIESEHTKPVEPWNLVAPKALALCVLGQANANKQPHLRARDWPSTVWSWWWEVGCGSDFRKFSKSTVRSVEFLDPQLTSSGWRKKFQLSHSFAESAVRHCFGSWIASFYGVEFVALVSKDTRLSFVESLLLEKLHKREMFFFLKSCCNFPWDHLKCWTVLRSSFYDIPTKRQTVPDENIFVKLCSPTFASFLFLCCYSKWRCSPSSRMSIKARTKNKKKKTLHA